MKLNELDNFRPLLRPEGNAWTTTPGVHRGVLGLPKLVEKPSKYNDDGTRVVIENKVNVIDEFGKTVELHYDVNYNWSSKGKLVKFLEKMGCLPQPGESLQLDELAGIEVEVTVENVVRDGNTYSNIIAIRRLEEGERQAEPVLKPLHKAIKNPEQPESEEDDFSLDD